MKLKYQFHFQPIGATYIGVAVGEGSKDFSGMLQLNETGYDIVSLMNQDVNEDQIIEHLLTLYDADRATLAGYVSEVVEYLKGQGVLA